MELRPLLNRMIIDQEDDVNATESGLIMSTDERSFRYGTIRSMGKECKEYEVGDRVMYVKEAVEEIKIDEGLPTELTFAILYNESDIYAKIK